MENCELNYSRNIAEQALQEAREALKKSEYALSKIPNIPEYKEYDKEISDIKKEVDQLQLNDLIKVNPQEGDSLVFEKGGWTVSSSLPYTFIPPNRYIIKKAWQIETATTIPDNSVIEFNGGKLIGGSLISNNSKIIPTPGCISNTLLVGFTTSQVNTNYFDQDKVELNDLLSLVEEGGTISLTRDIQQSQGYLSLSKSFHLKGNGYTLFVEGGFHSKKLFDNKNANFITIENLKIDGQLTPQENYYNASALEGKGNPTNLMYLEDVKTIKLQNLQIKNLLYYTLDTAGSTAETQARAACIGINKYEQLFINNCLIQDVTCVETIFATSEDTDPYNEITNNTFIGQQWSLTKINRSDTNFYYKIQIDQNYSLSGRSTWIGIMNGTGKITNNSFGTCSGSAMNVFMHDTEIAYNVIEKGMRSCAIDISEGGWRDWVPYNVNIHHNRVKNNVGGFMWLGPCKDITIANNLVDNSELPDPIEANDGTKRYSYLIAFQGSNSKDYKSTYENVQVLYNKVYGMVRPIYDGDGKRNKKNLVFKNNEIFRNANSTFNTSIFDFWGGIDGLIIDNNTLFNNNCKPQYVSKATVGLEPSKATFININTCQYLHPDYKSKSSHVTITNNIFETETDNAILFSTEIARTDQLLINDFGQIDYFEFSNNVCETNSKVIIIDNRWDRYYLDNQCTTKITNNLCKNLIVISNLDFISDYVPKNLMSISDYYTDGISIRYKYQQQGIRLNSNSSCEILTSSGSSFSPRICVNTTTTREPISYKNIAVNSKFLNHTLTFGQILYLNDLEHNNDRIALPQADGTFKHDTENTIVFILRTGACYTGDEIPRSGNTKTFTKGPFLIPGTTDTYIHTGVDEAGDYVDNGRGVVYKVIADLKPIQNRGYLLFSISNTNSLTKTQLLNLPMTEEMTGTQTFSPKLGYARFTGEEWVNFNNEPFVREQDDQDEEYIPIEPNYYEDFYVEGEPDLPEDDFSKPNFPDDI